MVKPSLFFAFLPIFSLHQSLLDANATRLNLTNPSVPSSTRSKRDFQPSSNSVQPCGCLSKYTPINCRCTTASGNNDELLCRCDRAMVPTNREDGSRGGALSAAQCGGNCQMPAGESNRQQQQAGAQHGFGTFSYGGPAPIHSACHPICHKSCTSSCVASRTTDQNNFSGFPQPAPPLNELQHPQQHNQPSTMVENNQASNNNNNCFPSQCRANCLRACARIFEGQQQQQNRESFVPTNGIDSNDVDPHYQVETGQNKQSPDYASGRNGGANNGCQCSPATVCECQETCYPVCIDTCESNCLQQQSQQTPANQRARCAQFCHLECQHDCAVEQQQQRIPTQKAVEAMETVNNNIWQSNNRMNTGTQIGNPIVVCAQKCPRSCEQACHNAQNGEPNNNCVPACIGLCAQSCARGIQFDAAGLTQQMAVPMPTMALDLVGPAQQLQNRSNNNGGEFEQHQQQMNDWEIGDSAQMLPNFGQNDGPNMAAIGNDDMPPSTTTTTAATIIPQAMEDNRQEQAVTPTTEIKPCAPLCEPECRPECNKRYMEERPGMERSQQHQQQPYGQMVMSNNGIISRRENGGKSGGAASGVGGELMRLDQQNQNDQQPPPPKQQRSAPQSSFFPPHIILDEGLLTAAAVAPPANDDESNVTTNGPPTTNNDDNKQQTDKMSWLRPQNETGGWDRNGAMPPYQQKLTKLGGAREKQQQIIKDHQQEQQRQKVPNVKGGGKQRAVHHRHHNRLTKDGKIGRPASDFFRRRRILFSGGEPKVPKMAKKVPKNRQEAKIEPLKAEKTKEKSGDIGTKQQKANKKKWH